MTGKVYFVGAGPGDPDLLTLKAARVLRNADVVLRDELIGNEVLRLIPSRAQIYNVGKRCGTVGTPQRDTNLLMVSLALSGLQVVRLKGGDPSVFGRLGEEIAALRQANIEFEIVPGITAALGVASSAVIPLTHRQDSHAVVFLAGRSAGETEPSHWDALVSLGATIVIYMPGYQYSKIALRLQAAGLSPETLCAIVSRATTPQQQIYWANVGKLRDAPHLPAPTLLVIGNVVRHAGSLLTPQGLGSWLRGMPNRLPSTNQKEM